MSLHVVKTKLSAEEAIEKAVEFFGKEGLNTVDRERCSVHFRGNGGHLSVRAITRHGTTLNLDTREWDDQVKRFIREIA